MRSLFFPNLTQTSLCKETNDFTSYPFHTRITGGAVGPINLWKPDLVASRLADKGKILNLYLWEKAGTEKYNQHFA